LASLLLRADIVEAMSYDKQQDPALNKAKKEILARVKKQNMSIKLAIIV